MADSEEFRLKRLKHEQHLSRVFDEVMGLGDFAESSRGSASSSKSGGQEDTKGAGETSGQEEPQQAEGDSDSSRPEEKMDEGAAESPLLTAASPSERRPSFTMETNDGGGSGGAAFDDALDGLPAFGVEDEEEDWHFALPMGSLEDVDVDKANRANKQAGKRGGKTPGDHQEPREEDEDEDEEEEMPEKEGSTGSANTSHSSRDHTPENSRDVGSLNQAEETEDSQDGGVERSEAAPIEDSNPPMSPVNIKDEPIDEGYDAALLPQSSAKQIKEELDQEEELRISSVYSVGGANTFVPPTVPVPVSTPTPTAIFIPGRGAVLQAMAPLPVRPPAPVMGALTSALTPVVPRPPIPQIPGSVRCSGCSKVLLKGQTAFQRKGSTQLFCSTVCLTGHLPPAAKSRTCFQCNKDILQPRDMITIPADDNNYIYVCSQFCLSVLRHKKKDKIPIKGLEKKPEKLQEKPPEREKLFCSVCKISNRIEHEVSHQGRLHRLCSDACFLSWRKMRQLAMNCCEGCGLYCNSKSGSCQTLTIERSQLNFCGPTCISTYKQSCRKTAECAFCRKTVVVSSTLMERDLKGKVQLYCSSTCVDQSRPPRHILSGTAFPCCLCKVSAVPQYHLAMVDGTIRNFCSYDCVTTFRKSGHPSQMEILNGVSRAGLAFPPIPQDYPSAVPYPGHHPSNSSVPPLVPPYSPSSVPGQTQARIPSKPGAEGASDNRLTCYQCSKQFGAKPQLISHQGRISVFCSKTCCDQYKTQRDITAVCDNCKKEKVIYDTINYNQQDLFFCSDNCKMLFKHDLTARNNDYTWRPCSYCSSYNPKMLHSHYGGRMEEFCKPHCMSQYTVLYYGMGRCDNCRRQGYLTDKLQCMGSVRNFCNLPCLLQYCYMHFEPIQHVGSNGTGTAPQTPHAPTQPHLSSKMNPVIADVVSLANGSATQPSVSADTAQTGALPTSTADSKNLDHASTQTDALRIPRRCQMKNKSVLCRPFTMDQESMCVLPAASTESAALLDSASQAAPPTTDASTSPAPSPEPQAEMKPCNGLPARLTGRHFLGKRDADSDCKVCSQHKRRRAEEREDGRERKRLKAEKTSEEKDAKGAKSPDEIKEEDLGENKDCEGVTARSQTSYYCKTCSGEPSLCPVPCFELYHTKLIYKNTPDLETQGVPFVGSSAEAEKVKVLMVPVPVPVFIPVPMNMFSQHTPVPMAMPVPIAVPMVIPPRAKDVRDAAVQSDLSTVEDENQKEGADHSGGEEASKAAEDHPPHPQSSEQSTESPREQLETPAETTSDPERPSSPMMDLETDFPAAEAVVQKTPAPRRGVKRPREGSSTRKRTDKPGGPRCSSRAPAAAKLNHVYGVKAWRSWVQQRNKRPAESRRVDVKEDVLQCDSAELSFALSRFITEVRRPNGESYSPDSIFYLCLGIQQYLFTKGRIENIFTDELYSQFATEISGMLRHWKPKTPPGSGVVSSRVEESYLWECKQLGAYSPIVLLNTLLFFCTRNFRLTTAAQHQRLSFSSLTRHWKPCSRTGKVHYLRYQRGCATMPTRAETERVRKRQELEDGDLEMLENVTNPLHCPVRLYEFYLSRCPESVKKRTDLFYLQPERNVHTDSCHWYTTQPLEQGLLQNMLTRILAVREVQQDTQQSSASADAPQST